MPTLLKKINRHYYPDKKIHPLPKLVMIEPSSVCNLKCLMCATQQKTRDSRFLSFLDFEKIIKQFPVIKELVFCGIGEPLLNPELFEMVKLAKKRNIRFMNLITNGKLLTKENANKIIDSGVDRVQISVHSFSQDVFSKLRNDLPENLENLKNNIKHLVSLKKGRNNPQIICTAVITKVNLDFLLDFIREAKKLGLDGVEFFQLTTYNDSLKYLNVSSESTVSFIREAKKLAKKINLEIGFLNGNDYGRCYQLWNFIMIHADGMISPCNGIFPFENTGLGNILSEPLERIWNSENYNSLRESLKNNQLKNCRYCEVGYSLEGKNFKWFKNYYLRPIARNISRANV